LPLERLVEEMAPQRRSGVNPLFQVLLALNDVTSDGRLELPGLAVEEVEIPARDAKFDLTLFLAEREGGYAGHLAFDRDLFDAATAERFAGPLPTLLAGAVAAPETRLSRLPLLSTPERAQIAAWSRAPRSGHRPWCVHARIAERAARQPEAEAVVGAD